MKFVKSLGYKVFSDDLSLIPLREDLSTIINTINPHSYIVAKKDVVFQKALKESDILLPDGIGIVWAVKFLTGQKIKRIAGADIHDYLLRKMNSVGGKVFYMGSSQKTLQKIEEKIKKQYPNIFVESYSPPFKTEFSAEDNNAMIMAINKVKPDVLFVGMTAPKQEKWVYQNKEKINAKIICSIGAVFDFYAGTIQRAPVWMQEIGLEWFHRFLLNPRRMWRRYIVNNLKFIFYVFQAKTKKRKL